MTRFLDDPRGEVAEAAALGGSRVEGALPIGGVETLIMVAAKNPRALG